MSLPALLLFTHNPLELFSPSAIHDNHAVALEHCVQPLAATLFRLPDDIVGNLGPVEPEQFLVQGESGKDKL